MILIAILLLLDHDNLVLVWTITGVVRQYPVTISAIGFLSCFALLYPWIKNKLHRLPWILCPLHYAEKFKKCLTKSRGRRAIPRRLIEFMTKQERFKRERNTSSLINLEMAFLPHKESHPSV